MIQFSIIVCTHNPSDFIFRRLLSALSKFTKTNNIFEILLVDNNSQTFIGFKDYVKDFVSNPLNNARVLHEEKPGLTSARLKGISESNSDWLIFFDDDNEPDEFYLSACSSIILQHPEVCAWGPGVVKVEYLKEKIPVWFKKNKQFYQESFIESVLFDNKAEWCNCYPNGTGLVIKKEVANYYKVLIDTGLLSLSDRIGKSLVSGGDTQMVLCGLKLGYFAGVSPNLKLNHLISENKINRSYLFKHAYMLPSCYVKAFNELNFENKQIPIILEGNFRILTIFYNTCRIYLFRVSLNNFLILFYNRLGEVNARYYAGDIFFKPVLLKLFEKLINV